MESYTNSSRSIAFDIGAGMVCNSLNSCKRFYHSPPKATDEAKVKIIRNHLIFSTFHIHTIIISLLYSNMDWVYGLCWYVMFIISVLIVYRTPLYLKRPTSILIILIAILLNTYVISPIKGFEWLAPMLFIKIVYGHLVREEPYDKFKI